MGAAPRLWGKGNLDVAGGAVAKGSPGGECGQELLHLQEVRKGSSKEGRKAGDLGQRVVLGTQQEPKQSRPALPGALLLCGQDWGKAGRRRMTGEVIPFVEVSRAASDKHGVVGAWLFYS